MTQIQKTAIVVLGILPVLFSFGPAKDPLSSFQAKIDVFSKRYQDAYEFSDESVSYQNIFDRMRSADWAGTVTLKSKKIFSAPGRRPYQKRLFFSFYYYKDTANVQFGLDSIQKCFPPNCLKIKKMVNNPDISSIPSIYIFNRHTIITCHIDCKEKPAEWESLKRDFLKTFAESHSLGLSADCNGPLTWYKK